MSQHPRSTTGSVLAGRRRIAVAALAAVPLTLGVIAMAAPAQAAASVQAQPLGGSHPMWATSAADRGATPAATPIDVRVYLAGRDPQGLAAYARNVSDPKSASYGRYLSPAQVQSAFGPTSAQVSAVKAWLGGAGLEGHRGDR